MIKRNSIFNKNSYNNIQTLVTDVDFMFKKKIRKKNTLCFGCKNAFVSFIHKVDCTKYGNY